MNFIIIIEFEVNRIVSYLINPFINQIIMIILIDFLKIFAHFLLINFKENYFIAKIIMELNY